jgi:hypothetical protein
MERLIMCLIICKWCGNALGSLPCYYCQYPNKFKKEHPRLFKKYEKQKEEIHKHHRCNSRRLKERVEYFRNLWLEETEISEKLRGNFEE